MTKKEINEKIGKKWFLDNQQVLAARLDYISGIKIFDDILQGKTLIDIDAVIHLEKFPKGLLVKIAKGFGGITTIPFPISHEEINKVILSEKIEKNKQHEKENSNQTIELKKHGFPAFLSFLLPGLGQLIKGHFVKSLTIWLAGIIIWFGFMGALFSGQFGLSVLLYLIPAGVWLWNIYDAYNSNTNWIVSTNVLENTAHLRFELKTGDKILFGIKQRDINDVKDFLKEIKLTYNTD